MNKPRGFVAGWILAFSALLSAGCNQHVDLASIQQLAKTTDAAAPAYAAISSDFYDSCKRAREWELTGQWRGTFIRPEPIQPVPPPPPPASASPHLNHAYRLALAQYAEQLQRYVDAERHFQTEVDEWEAAVKAADKQALAAAAAVPAESHPTETPAPATAAPTLPARVPLPAYEKASDPCQIIATASQQWNTMNLVLINYIDALGNLAGSNETSNNAYGFDTLATSLSSSSVLSAGEATALQNLFQTVAKDVFAQRRRDALATTLGASDAKNAVNGVIDRLEGVADVDYRGLLDIERLDINEFFTRNFQSTQPGLENLQTLAYRQQWRDALQALDQKVGAIDEYRNSLEALRSAHASLIDRAQSGSGFSDFRSTVSAYVSEYSPDIQAIEKAFADH